MERAELTLVEAYEAANKRPITELELQLLRSVAARFDAVARRTPGMDGVRLVCAAIDALAARQDLPIAPRKVRLWCEQWASLHLSTAATAAHAAAQPVPVGVAAGAALSARPGQTRQALTVVPRAGSRARDRRPALVPADAVVELAVALPRGGAPVALADALDGLRMCYMNRAARQDRDGAGQRPEGKTSLVQRGLPTPIREVREIAPVPEVKPVEPIAPPVEAEGPIEALGSDTEPSEAVPPDDLQALWAAVLARLERRVSPANFAVWLRSTRALSWQGDVLRVGVPNRFAQQWIETRFRRDVHAVLAALLDRPARVVFVVVPFDEPPARTSA